MNREKIKKAYSELGNYRGAKELAAKNYKSPRQIEDEKEMTSQERAAQVYGVSGTHFRKLLKNEETPSDVLSQMYQAIKQAAFEAHKDIKKINMELGNKV